MSDKSPAKPVVPSKQEQPKPSQVPIKTLIGTATTQTVKKGEPSLRTRGKA